MSRSTASNSPRFSRELYLAYDRGPDDQQARMRLHNLGYPDDASFEVNLFSFQQGAGLTATGQLDDATRRALVDAHGTLATDADPPQELDDGSS